MIKLGFLFGAGAEASANMPMGGKFALEILKKNKNDGEELKNVIRTVKANSQYAKKWLPKKFKTRNVSSFSKVSLKTVLKDTIENNKETIISELNDFDELCKEEIKRQNISNLNFNNLIKKITKKTIGDIKNTKISFSKKLTSKKSVFNSKYFLCLYEIYLKKKEEIRENEKRSNNKTDFGEQNIEIYNQFRKIIVSIIQLLISAYGKELIDDLNESIIVGEKGKNKLLDELGGIYKIDYTNSGLEGLFYLLDNKVSYNVSGFENEYKLLEIYRGVLENVYSKILNYKSLIDNNWSYLFCPKSEWSKFTRIGNFLYRVSKYIEDVSKNVNKDGLVYYNRIREAVDSGKIEISAIATTNYTKFAKEIIGTDVKHLNGSVDMMFDPYLNKVYFGNEQKEREKHIIVPMLFTQSGIKPMTSIKISEMYVDAYRNWKNNSDAIVVIGFGFNVDDEHVNTIIRTLLMDDNKKIYIVDTCDKKEWALKLSRLKVSETNPNIKHIKVNINESLNTDNDWLDRILSDFNRRKKDAKYN